MMREYKAYDEYKDSGIEWIRDIPSHWKIIRWKYIIKVLTDFSANGSFADLKANVTYRDIRDYARLVRLTDLRVNLENDGVYVNKHAYNFLSKTKLYGGEFLIANVGAYTGHVELMPYVNYKCTLGPNMFLVKFNNLVLNKYMYYASLSQSIIHQLDLYGYSNASAQPSLNKTDFSSIIFTYPDKIEQQKIASFLDKKTAEIDEIINKKEKLIDHLEKYKKSVITEAVTKGKLGDKYVNEDGELVDDIEMKDSGVEWIGKIPKYCDAVKLKYILKKIEYGLSESSNGEGQYKILTMGNISDGEIIIPEKGSLDIIDEDYLLENMDLLFNRTNSMEQIAKVGIFRGKIQDKVTFASYLVRIVPNDNNNNEFINYMLNNYRFLSYAKSYAIPSINQANLNPTRYTNLFVIRFPQHIQQSLVNILSKKISKIDNLIQKTMNSIEKYKSYKKSLIFEAVTGKIDLRDYELEGGKEDAEPNNSREVEREELSEVN